VIDDPESQRQGVRQGPPHLTEIRFSLAQLKPALEPLRAERYSEKCGDDSPMVVAQIRSRRDEEEGQYIKDRAKIN